MKKPIILRKRYIPDEIVDISEDKLIYRDKDVLVTRWKTIRPRTDFCDGISYTFLNKGYKISKFYNADDEFICWYCDIIDVSYDESEDKYLITDLLLDVKISPDGAVEVLDTEELGEALASGLITDSQAKKALRTMDELLKLIETGNFPPEICNKDEYGRI